MDDSILLECNETELITMAHKQGIGRLKHGLPRELLIAIVSGAMDPLPEHLSGTSLTRLQLEATIRAKLEVMRSQLPGCTGRCTVYPCSDGRHSVCYAPNERAYLP